MSKEDLLKLIAQSAYNVGFGAKKHFATFDIVEKAPGWIGFISFAAGILGLFVDFFSGKYITALFLIIGLSSLYIGFYCDTKNSYEQKGKELTKIYNDLRNLYFEVKHSEKNNFDNEKSSLDKFNESYNNISISKQVFLSDWYAHYKFFWQHQIDWINEELKLNFYKDKIPLSFYIFILVLVFVLILYILKIYIC
ncbi:SLATT domain-containing protein [Pigmentibacter sp. JX0631]|uniref:SLATT domain-containing protein n=1 Tax=Pigmentibacter sp. JX0631 TaxID=2976982 RepID=UPI002469153D|nr:SLATT domain-containing protein [Pigmentibacter sp. JX0631]WGL61270.1 SLATT domain-containing protein [Pigmentibacter sp. JX0631]